MSANGLLTTVNFRFAGDESLLPRKTSTPRTRTLKREKGGVRSALGQPTELFSSIEAGSYGIFFNGPLRAGKLRVLIACTPAVWSPLNGVSVFGHPALVASSVESNHRPRWNLWT